MNKENEKELRKHLELQTKEELIEQIIIQTRTYENALNIIANKKELIDKAIEYIEKSMNNPQPFYEYLFSDENGNIQNFDKLSNILRGEDNE